MTLLVPPRHNVSAAQKQALWTPIYDSVDQILNITANGRALMVPIGDPAFEDSLTAPTKVTTRFSEAVDFTYTNSGRHLWATQLGYEGPGQIPVLYFDGVSDWLETPGDGAGTEFWNDDADNLQEPSYCWAMWVYVIAGTTSHSLFMKTTTLGGNGQDWWVEVRSLERFRAAIVDDAAGGFIGSQTNVLSDGWHHLVATKHDDAATSSSVITYVDGAADRADQTAGSYTHQQDGTENVRIGAATAGGSPNGLPIAGGSHGPIFEPVGAGAVWTPDQIQALYQRQAPELIYGWTAY